MFIRAAQYQIKEFKKTSITDGSSDAVIGDEIISDDGIVGNPKKYPESGTLAASLVYPDADLLILGLLL